mgnify:FL=1
MFVIEIVDHYLQISERLDFELLSWVNTGAEVAEENRLDLSGVTSQEPQGKLQLGQAAVQRVMVPLSYHKEKVKKKTT